MTSYGYWLQAASSGWPFVYAVPSLGKASSIPTIFCWGGSISPEGFLPYILLLVVIIVAIVVVGEGYGMAFLQSLGF
ncbi:hypothetical protein Tco_0134723 [Tanacetum coccineum]